MRLQFSRIPRSIHRYIVHRSRPFSGKCSIRLNGCRLQPLHANSHNRRLINHCLSIDTFESKWSIGHIHRMYPVLQFLMVVLDFKSLDHLKPVKIHVLEHLVAKIEVHCEINPYTRRKKNYYSSNVHPNEIYVFFLNVGM